MRSGSYFVQYNILKNSGYFLTDYTIKICNNYTCNKQNSTTHIFIYHSIKEILGIIMCNLSKYQPDNTALFYERYKFQMYYGSNNNCIDLVHVKSIY